MSYNVRSDDGASNAIRVDAQKNAYLIARDSAGVSLDASAKYILGQTKRETIRGKYMLHSGNITIVNSAQILGTDAHLHMIARNPPNVVFRIKRITCTTAATSSTAMLTTPRILLHRIWYQGETDMASTLLAEPIRSDYPPSLARFSILAALADTTRFTRDEGALMCLCLVTPTLEAVTPSCTKQRLQTVWEAKDENDGIILRGGQMLEFYQADAGTASDSRKLNISLMYEEVYV